MSVATSPWLPYYHCPVAGVFAPDTQEIMKGHHTPCTLGPGPQASSLLLLPCIQVGGWVWATWTQERRRK